MTATPYVAQKMLTITPHGAMTITATPPQHDNSIHDTMHGMMTATATPHAAQRL
jgi:hypothetical protein